MAKPGTITRFDGAAVWPTLPENAQAELGGLLLDALMGRYFDDFCVSYTPNGGVLCRISEAHDPQEILDLMADIFVSVVPAALLHDGDFEPAVPISYGPICRRCGCSNRDACEPWCCWVEADLCSACVGSEGGVDD